MKYDVQKTGAMIVESTTIDWQIVSAQVEFKIERQTLYVPGIGYVCTGKREVLSGLPSPKSHVYVVTAGSVEE
jgi:hypothetical protein